MALRYRTIAEAAQTEIVVRRSRFLTFVEPVSSEEEVVEQLSRIRKVHPSATHHCYAYQLKEPQMLQKSSDDGEPAGTAGRPILEAIQHQQIHQVLVIVVRYFGGVMLGAGGLIRAYGEAANEGLRQAGLIERRSHRPIQVTMDYPTYGKLEYALRTDGIFFDEVTFSDRVSLVCYPEKEDAVKVVDKIVEWTLNRSEICYLEEKNLDHRLN